MLNKTQKDALKEMMRGNNFLFMLTQDDRKKMHYQGLIGWNGHSWYITPLGKDAIK